MIIDQTQGSTLLPGVVGIAKIGFIIFAALYFIFSLVVIRQVALMAETVKTEFGGILKILSIFFALLSLGLLIFFIIGA
jgi:hypothetical protein